MSPFLVGRFGVWCCDNRAANVDIVSKLGDFRAVSSLHLRERLVEVSTLRLYGPADTHPSVSHDTCSENLQPSEILFTHAQPSTSRQRAVVAGEKARERWSGWSGAAWEHCGQQHGDYLLRRRRPSGMVHALAAVCEPVAQRESLCQGCRQNDGLRQHCMGRTACLPPEEAAWALRRCDKEPRAIA